MNNTIEVAQWQDMNIRWVELEGEWWAVGNDVANALGYSNAADALAKHVDEEDAKTLKWRDYRETRQSKLWENGDITNKKVITEFGIYSLIFSSKLPEAKQFKRWTFKQLQKLRKAAGIRDIDMFRMLSAENEKKMDGIMNTINPDAKPIDYIKAKTIADKATSNQFGYKKMIKKADMSPEMQIARKKNYADVLQLIKVKRDLGLDMSISKTIYNKKAM